MLIIVDLLETRLGNSHTLPASWKRVFLLFEIFSPRQNCFSFLTFFVSIFLSFPSGRPMRPLFSFLSSHFILVLLFEGRPISTVVLHPAGSQVCFLVCFFLEELEGKGEGAQNLALIP